VSVFDDWALTARASLALILANGRYWPTVAPAVHRQLRRWERRAQAIPDPRLREVALDKLHTESFNAEGTTTLATLAEPARRASVAQAIVALQVMYDYLDGLVEQPIFASKQSREDLLKAFDDAVAPTAATGDYYHGRAHGGDDGYLDDLVTTVRGTLAVLAANTAVAPHARNAAHRCARAQSLVHTHAGAGAPEVKAWAQREAAATALGWREFLAGAVTSALSVYALLVAGSNRRTTQSQARAIDETYLSIGALSTMLDSLIDYDQDVRTDRQWFLPTYQDRALLAERLAAVARLAISQARELPDDAHHVMTVIGVAAYYLSAPEAKREPARSVTDPLHQELKPLITPILCLMRTWRMAKRVRIGIRRTSESANKARRR
jgi:tetraprenyl-beta-curcumene synthase